MARKITRASLAEFAKEIAALEAAEARILSPREQECYVGGRDSAYSSFGTAVDDHQAHTLAGLDHDLLSTEVGSFDPHTRSAIGICSFSPSGAVTDDGSGFFEDGSGYITGSGGDIELPEVVIRDKGKKKKKKPTPSDPPSFGGGGGYWGGNPSPSQPSPDDDNGKQSHQDTNQGKSQSRSSNKYDRLFCKEFSPQLRYQIESILDNVPTLRRTLQWDSDKLRVHLDIEVLTSHTLAITKWTTGVKDIYISISKDLIDDHGYNYNQTGSNNNIFFPYQGEGAYESLVGLLMHEALHVMHYRQVQQAVEAAHENKREAYRLLKNWGYTDEFIHIFYEDVDGYPQFRPVDGIVANEHEYIAKYDHEAIREAIKEYQNYLQRQ